MGLTLTLKILTVTAYAENTAIFPSLLVVNNPSTGQFILDLSPSSNSNGSSVVYVTVSEMTVVQQMVELILLEYHLMRQYYQ